ncbi:MarR family winged helix-turn-helix transcriptional regulator [Ectobacillus panaciterrae]|uniref:MarR family winged helix-turn-helix transcriptional regulator n=1 Tax=Ectobacillus panaciterrae TaxID=363872 RepID=UPI0003F866EE|nr:MarR family transcriptional regulator [Ectobacillus panaciterrae]
MQIKRLERHPRTFGDAGPLTPSEIHTIDAIGYEGSILMSELAARLSITKGAVTQIFSRLETKELVKRSPHPDDSRAVMVSLTEKGKSAYRAHEELHLSFYAELNAQLDEKEIEIFEKCIQKLNEFLQK